ncbi:hypothetical protein C0995_011161 [Termitomyces sp. Mi166|nr:hypothetical protein C0995_011161 [Termitomyces sp. Mi166\
MGKWTPDYIDDVLHSKIKNLVSGAIKRVALEKTEPTITYEDFVHDLETGDSFTTSLIEVLVKELAERRTRPNINHDRRIITDRSARSLQQLAERNPNYHNIGRHFPRRRSATLTDYLTAPPLDMEVEEDEDLFEHMLDNGATIEGVRINSDLYDAYGGGQSGRAVSSPSPPAEEPPSPATQPMTQTHFRNGLWSATSSSGSSVLTRQPSIRRPARSRTTEFNEFTRRRRSTTRDNQNSRSEISAPLRRAQAARRFFPFFRTRRFESSDPWGPDAPSPPEVDDSSYAPDPSNVPLFNLAPPIIRDPVTMEHALADAEVSDERAQAAPAPRLRRGSVRAPESILFRHASPIPTILSPHVFEDGSPPVAEPTPDETRAPAEPTGYPTPSSTEHEFFA